MTKEDLDAACNGKSGGQISIDSLASLATVGTAAETRGTDHIPNLDALPGSLASTAGELYKQQEARTREEIRDFMEQASAQVSSLGGRNSTNAFNASKFAGLAASDTYDEQIKRLTASSAVDSDALTSLAAFKSARANLDTAAVSAQLMKEASGAVLGKLPPQLTGQLDSINSFAELSKQYDAVLGKLPLSISDSLTDERRATLEAASSLGKRLERATENLRSVQPEPIAPEPLRIPIFKPQPIPADPQVLEIQTKQLVLLDRLTEAAAASDASSKVFMKIAKWGLVTGVLTLLATLVGIAATLGWFSK